MDTKDLGLEEYYHPIYKVRLSFHAGKWYVEYRRKPKWFFDQWWWFDDSVHTEFNDAQLRATILSSEKGIREFRNKILEVDINQEEVSVEAPMAEIVEENSPNPFTTYMNRKSE